MTMLTEQYGDRAADGAHERMAQAWQWLCEQRAAAPDEADIWQVRWQHLTTDAQSLTALVNRLLRGEYRLSPLQLQGRGADRRAVWGAQDALVLKWVALSLQDWLPLHSSCEHVKGHGGGQASVHRLHALLTQPQAQQNGEQNNTQNSEQNEQKKTTATPDTDLRHFPWVCRTDIRGYYRNIRKETLLKQVSHHVDSPVLLDLVRQYVHYTVEDGGTFHTPEKGISRGCPLSPLMGALHLYEMDAHFAKQKHIHYARYMDDVIILAKSRWQLRRHTKRLKQWFSEYGFEAHPDKTQIGRTEKGFDWMGAWLTHEGVTDIAPRAKANHREKVRRLYERLARVPLWARKRERQRIHAKVSTYRKRWTIWAGALLAVSSCARADGPLVVLASGNIAGDTGVRFITSAHVSGAMHSDKWGNDLYVSCVSGFSSSCTLPGQTKDNLRFYGLGGAPAPMPSNSLSLQVVNVPGLYLIPTGTIRTHRILRAADGGQGNPCDVWSADGGASWAGSCAPYHVITNNSVWGGWGLRDDTGGQIPKDLAIWSKDDPGRSTDANLSLMAWATDPLSPGQTNIQQLVLGDYAAVSSGDLHATMDKPTRVIISGLNCSLTTPTTTTDLGNVDVAAYANTPAASSLFTLAVACSGTNSTDAAATTQVGVAFTPGTGATSADTHLTIAGQPGFYGNIVSGNTAKCTDGVPLDGSPDPASLYEYKPGAAGTTRTLPYTFTLCSTGDRTQVPGQYSMTATATIVNQ